MSSVSQSVLTRRPRKRWTPAEDNLLTQSLEPFLKEGCKISWKEVSMHVPGRTTKDCRKRWTTGLNKSICRGCWSNEEDERLRRGVDMYGNDWARISLVVKGRTGDQCSKRWHDVLNPCINRDAWTPEEDRLLLELYDKMGTAWYKIAAQISGRRAINCRNRACKILVERGEPKPGTPAAEIKRKEKLSAWNTSVPTVQSPTTAASTIHYSHEPENDISNKHISDDTDDLLQTMVLDPFNGSHSIDLSLSPTLSYCLPSSVCSTIPTPALNNTSFETLFQDSFSSSLPSCSSFSSSYSSSTDALLYTEATKLYDDHDNDAAQFMQITHSPDQCVSLQTHSSLTNKIESTSKAPLLSNAVLRKKYMVSLMHMACNPSFVLKSINEHGVTIVNSPSNADLHENKSSSPHHLQNDEEVTQTSTATRRHHGSSTGIKFEQPFELRLGSIEQDNMSHPLIREDTVSTLANMNVDDLATKIFQTTTKGTRLPTVNDLENDRVSLNRRETSTEISSGPSDRMRDDNWRNEITSKSSQSASAELTFLQTLQQCDPVILQKIVSGDHVDTIVHQLMQLHDYAKTLSILANAMSAATGAAVSMASDIKDRQSWT